MTFAKPNPDMLGGLNLTEEVKRRTRERLAEIATELGKEPMPHNATVVTYTHAKTASSPSTSGKASTAGTNTPTSPTAQPRKATPGIDHHRF